MSWPEWLKIRVNMTDRKGYVSNIAGEPVGIQDQNGRALTSGFSMLVKGVRNVQPDPSRAQYPEAEVLVLKSTGSDHKRESYTIRVPVSRLVEDLPGVIREGVGTDAQYETKDSTGKLLTVILAASVHPETAPTYTTESWMESDGWYFKGVKVGSAVEISRLVNDPESNATLYVLRAPRLSGQGWAFSKPITWDQIQSGDYGFTDGRSISVSKPTITFMAMDSKWNSLTEGQRNSQMLEERNQPAADRKRMTDRAFGFRDWDALSR